MHVSFAWILEEPNAKFADENFTECSQLSAIHYVILKQLIGIKKFRVFCVCWASKSSMGFPQLRRSVREFREVAHF
jgi:hypothetical protein